MRDIAVVGSGIAGLVAAHALRRANQDVTIYTDRSAEQWLHESRPTGTAARFETALAFERELGLNHWDDVAPRGEGVFLTFCPTLHKPLVTLLGRLARPFQAVDLRLQCARWLTDFDGRVVHESVTVERLGEIAAKHELTIVAAGRAELSRLFDRNESRSTYREPQRKLAMIITVGGPHRVPDLPLLPVKFDFLGTDGEIFFIPYWHKDRGRSWNILVEAKPGSRMDRFAGVRTGEEAVAITKQIVKDLFPWDEPFVRDMELADPLGWLTGAVTPAVRNPVGEQRDQAGAPARLRHHRPREAAVRRGVDAAHVRDLLARARLARGGVQQSPPRAAHRAGEGAADRAVRQRRARRQLERRAADRERLRGELQRPGLADAGIHRHAPGARDDRADDAAAVAVERDPRPRGDRARSDSATRGVAHFVTGCSRSSIGRRA
jgi:hypothetical protein